MMAVLRAVAIGWANLKPWLTLLLNTKVVVATATATGTATAAYVPLRTVLATKVVQWVASALRTFADYFALAFPFLTPEVMETFARTVYDAAARDAYRPYGMVVVR